MGSSCCYPQVYKENQLLKKQYQQLDFNYKNCFKENQHLKSLNQNNQTQIAKLNRQITLTKQQRDRLKDQIYQHERLSQSRMKMKFSQISKLRQQQLKLRTQLKNIQEKNKKQTHSLSFQIQQLMQEQSRLKNLVRYNQQNQSKNRNQINRMNNVINGLRLQLNSTIINNKKEYDQLKRQKQAFDNRLIEASYQLQKQKKVLNDTISAIKQQYQKRISQYKIKIDQLYRNLPKGQAQIAKVFQGALLQNDDDQKEYLIEELENRFRFKIIKTHLLYKFDPLNKTNFHKYIDNKQHIVLIIRSSQDYLFGAYSQPAFSERTVAKGSGLIFSLTSRKVFGLASPNSKAISYDSNSLIFGNNQIRLKHLQDKVFSNFGISNSYYENNGENTYILYGTNQKQQKILGYQIYSLQIA